MPDRHIAKVIISSDLLFDFLTQGTEFINVKVKEGLPIDSEFISSYFNENTMQAILIFQHPSFPAITQGAEIPVLDIVIERL